MCGEAKVAMGEIGPQWFELFIHMYKIVRIYKCTNVCTGTHGAHSTCGIAPGLREGKSGDKAWDVERERESSLAERAH